MSPRSKMERCRYFSRQHLKELAAEVVGWHDTGILHNGEGGILRELADMIPVADQQLSIAENIVKYECLKRVSEEKP